MHIACIHTKQDIRYEEAAIPVCAEDEVLIRVEASGICGTDVHIFDGDYMGSYPIIPGHEFSGVVVETGASVKRVKKNERVAVEPNLSCGNCEFCFSRKEHMCVNWQGVGVTRAGGMAQYVAVPEKAVFNTQSLDFEVAAFMEPLSCVLDGIELANIVLGSSVLVLGAGPIGMLLLRVLRTRGAANIEVVEMHEGRRTFAQREGYGVFADMAQVQKQAYDVVIDATGVLALQEATPYFVKPAGTVLLFGVPPQSGKISIEPFYFFKNEITLISSFTSLRNSLQALALLQSKALRVDDLISHRVSLAEFEKGVHLMKNKSDDALMKVMIYPQGL